MFILHGIFFRVEVRFKAKNAPNLIVAGGSAPDPAGGAYSAPPNPLAVFKGPISNGRQERDGRGKEGTGKEALAPRSYGG